MARQHYPSEEQERFIVRLPDGMRDRIKAAAEENKRSMNAEIVARLEASFAEEEHRPEFEPVSRELLHRMTAALIANEEQMKALKVFMSQSMVVAPTGAGKSSTATNVVEQMLAMPSNAETHDLAALSENSEKPAPRKNKTPTKT